MTEVLRLLADVVINVAYQDATVFGSPVSDRPDQSVRHVFAPLLRQIGENRHRSGTLAGAGMLDAVMASAEFATMTEPAPGGWRVLPAVLYPDVEQAPPIGLIVASADHDGAVRVRLTRDRWGPVHQLLAALTQPGLDPATVPALHPDLRPLLEELRQQRLVGIGPPNGSGAESQLAATDLTFVGHNAVVLRTGTTRVIIDPFLPARSDAYPDDYQPLQVPELGPVDAIVITHSHPDHFSPDALLRFPPTTRVIVPRVERETLLTVAMATRLGELGFTNVREIWWHERETIGDMEITALPFFGEQPGEAEVLHADIRNAGCTYVVRTSGWSAAFLADSGRDASGAVHDVAVQNRAADGPVDVVFCGYRGWVTYPAQLLLSSVARYALLVPPDQWGTRQRLMCDADDAIDVAERWGAKVLIPYADGGAPWYWRLGLGPVLDGSGVEALGFDPFPDRVVEAADRRTQLPDGTPVSSPVKVLLLRPGDSLVGAGGEPELVRVPGHAWPYG